MLQTDLVFVGFQTSILDGWCVAAGAAVVTNGCSRDVLPNSSLMSFSWLQHVEVGQPDETASAEWQ